MRHRKKGRQLGRKTKPRRALFRSLVTSLLDQERIETTEAKAKELRGFTERMITLGKQGDLPARRRALGFLLSKDVVSRLFGEVAERFRDRPGGYTRVIKTRRRVGDAAKMVAIELVAKGAGTAHVGSGHTDAGKETKKPKPAAPTGSKASSAESRASS
ncbi:MAG: 50S ribosomal protein L17 [Nitrospiraceae bacterium]